MATIHAVDVVWSRASCELLHEHGGSVQQGASGHRR